MEVERRLSREVRAAQRVHAVLLQWARTMHRRAAPQGGRKGALLLYLAASEAYSRCREKAAMLAKVHAPFVERLMTTLDDWSYAKYVEARHRVNFFDALAAELEWAWRFKYTVSVRQWRSANTEARRLWITALWQVWEEMRARKQEACNVATRTARFCALEMRAMRDTHAQMQAALTDRETVMDDDEPYWLHVETSSQLHFVEDE